MSENHIQGLIFRAPRRTLRPRRLRDRHARFRGDVLQGRRRHRDVRRSGNARLLGYRDARRSFEAAAARAARSQHVGHGAQRRCARLSQLAGSGATSSSTSRTWTRRSTSSRPRTRTKRASARSSTSACASAVTSARMTTARTSRRAPRSPRPATSTRSARPSRAPIARATPTTQDHQGVRQPADRGLHAVRRLLPLERSVHPDLRARRPAPAHPGRRRVQDQRLPAALDRPVPPGRHRPGHQPEHARPAPREGRARRAAVRRARADGGDPLHRSPRERGPRGSRQRRPRRSSRAPDPADLPGRLHLRSSQRGSRLRQLRRR